jgi:alpha-D-ribose 1-methylphosphonate 5-triphosphate synthase subunit PhnH
MTAHGLIPAPADVVQVTQATFRAALTALSEPMRALPVPSIEAPEGVRPALWAMVLTLLDADVSLFWPECSDVVRANLGFHTRVRIVDTPEVADWLVLDAHFPQTRATFDAVRIGTAERPDLAASVLLITTDHDAVDVVAQGPGIATTAEQRLPIPVSLAERLAQQTTTYPLGFDTFLVLKQSVIGLPRSTRLSVRVD